MHVQREIKMIFDSLDSSKNTGFPETEELRRQLKEVQIAKKPLHDEKGALQREIRCDCLRVDTVPRGYRAAWGTEPRGMPCRAARDTTANGDMRREIASDHFAHANPFSR
jgi:hypothetical protein